MSHDAPWNGVGQAVIMAKGRGKGAAKEKRCWYTNDKRKGEKEQKNMLV
jgi:hypothetical protein